MARRRRPSGAQRRKRTAQRQAEDDAHFDAALTEFDTSAEETASTPETTPTQDTIEQQPAAPAAAPRAHDEAKGAPSPIDVVKSQHLCQLIGLGGPKPVADAPFPSTTATASPTTSEVVGYVEGNEGPADGSMGGHESEEEDEEAAAADEKVGGGMWTDPCSQTSTYRRLTESIQSPAPTIHRPPRPPSR